MIHFSRVRAGVAVFGSGPLSAACRNACAAIVCLALFACGGGAPADVDHAPPPPAPDPVAAGTIEHFTIPSTALGRPMAVAVYLPPGYSAAARYPVLYLFYGYGGNQDTFFDGFLSINRSADRLLSIKAIEPMIMVAPDYANSFAVNSTVAQAANSGGGSIGMYADYLITELLPAVDSRYSTDARRERRYAGGFSMGGYAALYLGLAYADKFSRIGGHSAALWDYSANDQFIGQRDWLYATPQLRAERDPLLMAAGAGLTGQRFYLDVGSADRLRPQDEAMYQVLAARGASVEIHTPQGGHDASYWSSQLENYLRFYGQPR